MSDTEKAIKLVQSLTAENLEIAVGLLKLLAENKNPNDVKELADLIKFELSCEAIEVSPEEKRGIAQGAAELKAGLGVPAEDVWKELGI